MLKRFAAALLIASALCAPPLFAQDAGANVAAETPAALVEADAFAASEREEDWLKAIELYRAAADTGDANGFLGLALMLDSGKGARIDAAGAAKLYESAAELGSSEAAHRLGTHLGREFRAHIQEYLQADGFYDGAIDGSFGRGTRAALAAALGFKRNSGTETQ